MIIINEFDFKKRFLLNEYLIISKWGDPIYGEYNIKFKDPDKFLQDIKNLDSVVWDFGNGFQNRDLELANMVSSFVKPFLPFYTKLIVKMNYLAYQRQERPTKNCMSNHLIDYVNLFNFDSIEVDHLHDSHVPFGVTVSPTKCLSIGNVEGLCIVFPDEGCKNLLGLEILEIEGCSPKVYLNKQRVNGEVKTDINKEDIGIIKSSNKICVIDDIISGGDSIINTLNLIKKVNLNVKISIGCIFLMSEYGRNNIKKHHPDVEITYLFKLSGE